VKRVLALGALLSVLPTAGVLLFVRPAAAADPVYDQLALSALVSGVRTGGAIGASGGLVTLDSGSAYLSASLDSSPSAQVLAAPYEPGTLARTGVGQLNGGAGQSVIDVPDAEARYPGAQTTATYESTPSQAFPPLSFGSGRAGAETGSATVSGYAQASSFAITGVLSVGPSTSSLSMTTSVSAGTVTQLARTAVSHVDVAGVLQLEDVVATAGIKADHDTHNALQDLTVGGASVGGQAVQIGNGGVTAVGTAVLPGQSLEEATKTANAQLAQAGITVHTVGGSTAHDRRSATADTGGIEIQVATPDLPGGVAGNSLQVVVGGISLTELDALTVPTVLPPLVAPPVTPLAPGITTTTTIIPGVPGTPGLPAVQPPTGAQLAAPPTTAAAFVVGGRQLSAQTAVIAFAGWQLVSLGTATLYAFVDRRRRLVALGRAA
jgi:hypothetical protein